jgi:hypothetical protein
MSVCVYSVFVFSCVGSGLVTGWSPVQGVLPTVYKCKIKEPRKRRIRPDMGRSAIGWMEEYLTNSTDNEWTTSLWTGERVKGLIKWNVNPPPPPNRNTL